jgi:LysR family cyn operon transcriptional activator
MARSNSYKDIELRQLRSFCLAAAHGNFTSAARTLELSVPTVWEQVRALERKLGARLLLRRGRTLELTAEGRLLLKLTQPHVSGLDSLERIFQAERAELPQQLGIASVQSLLTSLLARPIREFTATHPAVQLKLLGHTHAREIAKLVEQGEVDLGILTCNSDEPASAQLEYEHLLDLSFALITATRHPLARRKRVRPLDLVAYPLLTMQDSSPNRRMLERILRQHGLAERAHFAMENASADVLQQYAALGAGVALAYVLVETEPPFPGLHRRVFDPSLERMPVALVCRRHAPLPEAALEFRRLVRRHLPTVRRRS